MFKYFYLFVMVAEMIDYGRIFIKEELRKEIFIMFSQVVKAYGYEIKEFYWKVILCALLIMIGIAWPCMGIIYLIIKYGTTKIEEPAENLPEAVSTEESE